MFELSWTFRQTVRCRCDGPLARQYRRSHRSPRTARLRGPRIAHRAACTTRSGVGQSRRTESTTITPAEFSGCFASTMALASRSDVSPVSPSLFRPKSSSPRSAKGSGSWRGCRPGKGFASRRSRTRSRVVSWISGTAPQQGGPSGRRPDSMDEQLDAVTASAPQNSLPQ
jgi:hypothetical protein